MLLRTPTWTCSLSTRLRAMSNQFGTSCQSLRHTSVKQVTHFPVYAPLGLSSLAITAACDDNLASTRLATFITRRAGQHDKRERRRTWVLGMGALWDKVSNQTTHLETNTLMQHRSAAQVLLCVQGTYHLAQHASLCPPHALPSLEQHRPHSRAPSPHVYAGKCKLAQRTSTQNGCRSRDEC